MYITFRNASKQESFVLRVNGIDYRLELNSFVNVTVYDENNITFSVKNLPPDFSDVSFEEDTDMKLKDKLLIKLSEKFVKSIDKAALFSNVEYQLSNVQNAAVIDICESCYAKFDGSIADFFDFMPVIYYFSRAESDSAKIKVKSVDNENRKSYLKLMKKILLFLNINLLLFDLITFIPAYCFVKYFSTHNYTKKMLSRLYSLPRADRDVKFAEKEMLCADEIEDQETRKKIKKKTRLRVLLTVVIVFVAFAFLIVIGFSEPSVIVSEDLSFVQCFDEKFVRFDEPLPKNAEQVFLEDYNVAYPISDDDYDMESYYCYIYQTEDGTRYMWLKDDCDNETNTDKGYEDYKNPYVYISVGEITEEASEQS